MRNIVVYPSVCVSLSRMYSLYISHTHAHSLYHSLPFPPPLCPTFLLSLLLNISIRLWTTPPQHTHHTHTLHYTTPHTHYTHRYYAAPTMHHAILMEAEQRTTSAKEAGELWEVRYVTSQHSTVQYSSLHCFTPHYATSHYSALYYSTLHLIALQCSVVTCYTFMVFFLRKHQITAPTRQRCLLPLVVHETAPAKSLSGFSLLVPRKMLCLTSSSLPSIGAIEAQHLSGNQERESRERFGRGCLVYHK